MNASVEEAMKRAADHYKVVCRDCEKVLAQCRCVSRGKEIVYALCDECEQKPNGYGHGV